MQRSVRPMLPMASHHPSIYLRFVIMLFICKKERHAFWSPPRMRPPPLGSWTASSALASSCSRVHRCTSVGPDHHHQYRRNASASNRGEVHQEGGSHTLCKQLPGATLSLTLRCRIAFAPLQLRSDLEICHPLLFAPTARKLIASRVPSTAASRSERGLQEELCQLLGVQI